MFTNSEMNLCKICKVRSLQAVYWPLGSRYGTVVCLCQGCGVSVSIKQKFPEDRIKTTSSDADWGNVRHGKQLRFDIIRKLSIFKNLVHGDVLDVGSSRGDFVSWASAISSVDSVTGIEPDNSVFDHEKYLGVEYINERFENFHNAKEKYFDFIYCSQTLEHLDNPIDALVKARNLLKDSGHILIDVPNLDIIKNKNIVEEFFIDKHTYHFSHSVLLKIVIEAGFDIFHDASTSDNLIFILKKKNASEQNFDLNSGILFDEIKAIDFENYSKILDKNRDFLKRVVAERIQPLLKRQKCAFWGAGRILDALIKYGNLELKGDTVVIDTYLSGKAKVSNSIDIYSPFYLKIFEPDIVFILASAAEADLAMQAYEIGVRHVILFTEMLDQVVVAGDQRQ